MTHPGKMAMVHVDASRTFQTIDGFGVNINSRYWDEWLLPAMDLLLNDLGATLYRVDIWGKSNWLDPDGSIGRDAALNPEHQAKILDGDVFRPRLGHDALAQRARHPAVSHGQRHRAALDAGRRRQDADRFRWIRRHDGDDAGVGEAQGRAGFHAVRPAQRDGHRGSRKGRPSGAEDYVRVCEALDRELRARNLDDIKLVVAEQAHFNADYLKAFVARPSLKDRIGVFALHDYSDISPRVIVKSPIWCPAARMPATSLWMTEFGDLEQSGDREWYVAWLMTSTAVRSTRRPAFNGALVWDAYDNYHDHNEYWTIYGLLRTGLYTPHAQEALSCDETGLPVRASRLPTRRRHERRAGFACAGLRQRRRNQIVVTGINSGATPARLNVMLSGLAESVNQTRVAYYRTTETENCALTDHAPVTGPKLAVPSALTFASRRPASSP